MVLTLANALRGGGGLLMAALGLFLLVRRPRGRPDVVALGTFLVALGANFALANFGPEVLPLAWRPGVMLAAFVLVVFACVALGAYLALVRRDAGAAALAGAATAAVLAFALVLAVVAPGGSRGIRVFGEALPSSWDAYDELFNTSVSLWAAVLAGATLYAGRAFAGSEDPATRRRLAAVVLCVAPIAGSRAAIDLVAPLPWAFPLHAAIVLVLAAGAVAWALAARGPDARLARNVALWIVAWPLATLAVGAVVGVESADETGIAGIARTAGVAALVFAVLRWRVVDLDLGASASRRGALVSAALVTLLIVAQVAQNFLSAEYGLLTGGLAAGALVVLAQPLQRIADRVAHSARPAPREEDVTTYREAVRYALRDRVMTRAEEIHLARLGHALGLHAEDALRIRHEIEDEIGVTRS